MENINEDGMYLEDLVEEWLFRTAEKLENMKPGTEEYLLTCRAWNEVYQTWLDNKKTTFDVGSQESKQKHETKIERMKLIFALATALLTAGMSWGGYLLFGKIMQQWEDKGHIPLGSALKGLIRGAKTPKI